ncbi:hypothetical protein KUC3_04720 [Alteromonas sp. KC3]|uniref:hypothetical protein n=1 Tax=unclassified Alteromonas TaxID=2614992 RepID=UPI001920DA47|nr:MULTISPECIES: hypothetical protein [unclassified Alteromonas]BCO17615.1 hypothetical protein KUC3_04720 [Alteromonas sp. KC3]BCO21593.1 hypothetical protein KUC14_04620 [Alteromonas sp. KC14]
MEFVKNSAVVKYASSLLMGVLFAFLAVNIIGFGAAIAIPKALLTPLVSLSSTLGLTLVNTITIGIPLAIAYALISVLAKQFEASVNHLVLVSPFVFLMLSFLPNVLLRSHDVTYSLSLFMANIAPTLLLAVYLAKKQRNL